MDDPRSPVFNDVWRRWIAERILLETPFDEIIDTLESVGFKRDEAAAEIRIASASPYIQGADRLRNRVKKLQWLLKILSRVKRTASTAGIPVSRCISSEAFLCDYYAANSPIIFKGLLEDWPALARWTPEYFKNSFGDELVEVQMDRNSNKRYESHREAHRRRVRMAEFVEMVESAGPTNDFYLTARNAENNQAVLAEILGDIGTCPDFMRPPSIHTAHLWFGPAGTRTPLHHDPVNVFFAQVLGRKRVTLIPPYDTPFVYNTSSCYSAVDCEAVDYERFPQFREATKFVCELGPGDVLFIPVCWWHDVRSLSTSISLTLIDFKFRNDLDASHAPVGKV